MNKKHLFWIIPLCLFVGMVFYSIIDNHSEKLFFDALESCLDYEYNMDDAVILVWHHCVEDHISDKKNTIFCKPYIDMLNNDYEWRFMNSTLEGLYDID